MASTPRSSPTPAMKDVTLDAGIKDWTGDSKGRTVHEFFAQIDTYAKVSNWLEDEKASIANAKLWGIALQFVQGRETLINDAYLTDSVKRCQPIITILGYKMPCKKKDSVLKNSQIGVRDCQKTRYCM